MKPLPLLSSTALAFIAASASFVFSASAVGASAMPPSAQERRWETWIGQEMYAKYAQRGEIVARPSPLYAVLDPVANAVASVADRQYYTPFHFILLNESEPNAFSVPGGNVYVTTALLSFLRNRDELAGVICHEVNHDIHHDMYDVYQMSRYGAQPVAYEREAEIRADRAGAYTCAKAGFNPWGMVWNMRFHREMSGGQAAAGSDHPSDDQRLAELLALLRTNATFSKFRDDIAASMPLQSGRVYATRYPAQYQSQYPAQYQSQYPAQYQSQYRPQVWPQQPQQGWSQQPQQAWPQPQQGWSQPQPQMAPYPPPPPPPCYPGC